MSCEIVFPRLLISAQKGGAGKTLFSLGLVSALSSLGKKVIPFKKGPDYIDAGWLAFAARNPCYNLDPFFMSSDIIISSFLSRASSDAIAVIEGNRGLLDGVDVEGSCSSAQLAKILKTPVILVLDCTKVTRTLAAFVKGCQILEPDLIFGGVILNQIVRARHEKIITRSIETYTDLKVLGVLPRLRKFSFPMRHLGLLPWQEHGEGDAITKTLAEKVIENVDLEKIIEISQKAPAFSSGVPLFWPSREKEVKIGVFKDKAFQFYYQENFEALKALGAELIFLDALKDSSLPDIDALYIGGGFPETQAEALEANFSLRKDIRQAAMAGLPIYAECGGLMYLGRRIIWKDKAFDMVGALPIDFEVNEKPQGHGYVKAKVVAENPFYSLGTKLLGHEFHYSKPINWSKDDVVLAMKLSKGHGFSRGYDGVVYKNILGAYTHVHVLGLPVWAVGLIEAAKKWKQGFTFDFRNICQDQTLVLNEINHFIKF
ncbi:cobyrinate a,c-diamide synthase [Thermodesulfatator autotrophicus]|uniref:Cobyrinate a,c-diamide synthase n=1 Tax=Thermodesulfatator autotrophicus TaxID=1795632 RepID=A0A177E7I8_9BACT|nr:cobyrinate a,c-diamide synthase [Thermodesulfatator autotrophicus]OAG27855.1 cobyrinic acid a,c-diamide synthase [Thermodesulfatator autotrophicus]